MNNSDETQDFDHLGLGTLPEGWKYMPLGELVDSRRGISYGIVQPGYHVDVGVPIVRVNNLQNGRIESNDIMKVSNEIEKKYQRTRLKGGEVLLSLVGSLGQTAVVSRDILGWNVARAIAVIPVNSGIEPEWVNFALRSPLLQHYIRVWATTTVQATLNLGDVVRLPIPIPPAKERKAIIDILGSLDDKIELNHRMNRTLESMARAVFRQWFVENGDVSKWGTTKVSELAELDKGVSYKGAFLTDEGMPMINLGCFLGKGRFEIDKLKSYSGEYKKRHTVKPGDIVLANTDITQKREVIGSPAIVPDYPANEYLFTHHTYALRVKNDSSVLKHYLYFTLLQEEFRERAEGFATGTTVLALPRDAVLDYEIPMPPSDLLQSFYMQVHPMFQKIQTNIKESRTLASLRDTLLPKLMRGEVRVKDV
jgi:type I restriction enzyme, S subunit